MNDVVAAKRVAQPEGERKLTALLEQVRALAQDTSPITPQMVSSAPTWRAAYSDRTCALMAAFCGMAYDRFEGPDGVSREALEYKLAQGGFRLRATYDVDGSTQAFLATSEQFAVLAFRGTESKVDWGVNLDANLTAIDPADERIKVHHGFLAAFRSVEQQIRRDLDLHVPPNRGLYITGHSLGGALAQIASAALSRDNLAACYTFGSPRVGGFGFDRRVKCPHYRVVNDADLVPAVPPLLWRGFLHSGDVRTLFTPGQLPLRRNRMTPQALWNTVRAFVTFLFTRKFIPIDDHMIWNYRAKLDAVVGPCLPGDNQPMDTGEIGARLIAAILAAGRHEGVRPDAASEATLMKLAQSAARALVADNTGAEARERAVIQAELAYGRLMNAVAAAARSLDGHEPNLADAPALELAITRLGRLSPYW